MRTSLVAAEDTTTAAPTTTTTAPPVGPNARNDVHSTVLGLIGTIPVLVNDSAGSSPLDTGTRAS